MSACAPAAGGAVLVGVIAIGALTSHCYDYLDVTVFDAQGRKTCAATVTASSGSDHFELGSCYYAPLTDGVWTLRATLPGFPDAVTTVPVEHAHDCTRYVESVELTLKPAQPLRSVPPPLELRPAPQPLAPPASVPPASVPPASAPMPSAVPSASGTPAIGVFPNSP
ncbi:MAG: hypothetical protein ABI335_21470 [Polyangiaceae bacterium]